MSIPKWRQVQYEDDGVYSYECLSCYHGFSVATGYLDWKFCPYCGIEWEGEVKWEKEKYSSYVREREYSVHLEARKLLSDEDPEDENSWMWEGAHDLFHFRDLPPKVDFAINGNKTTWTGKPPTLAERIRFHKKVAVAIAESAEELGTSWDWLDYTDAIEMRLCIEIREYGQTTRKLYFPLEEIGRIPISNKKLQNSA